jgi:hypothetical protein
VALILGSLGNRAIAERRPGNVQLLRWSLPLLPLILASLGNCASDEQHLGNVQLLRFSLPLPFRHVGLGSGTL